MAAEEISWSNVVFKSGMATAMHPLDYAKTLIKLGYEPIAPVPTRTFFGRPALGLPSVFQYGEKLLFFIFKKINTIKHNLWKLKFN